MPSLMKYDEGRKARNPFLRPVVLFRKQREEFLREKSEDVLAQPQERGGLPNYMRSTQLSRRRTRPRVVIQDIVSETEESDTDTAAQPAFAANSGSLQKLTLSDYLGEQREKVYTKFANSVKRSIIEKLRRDIEMELPAITLAEKHVEEEEMLFQRLIEERQEKLGEALQLSEKCSKLKTQVTEESERKTAEIRKLKSDIESFREKLQEYTQYKDFLTGLAPPAWREQQALEKAERRRAELERLKGEEAELTTKGKKKSKHTSKTKKCSQKAHKKSAKKDHHQTSQIDIDMVSDSDEEPVIYFSEPQDVMLALDKLMEENLFHIQNFQNSEEDMNRVHKVLHQTRTKLKTVMETGSENIEKLKVDIKVAEEIASELELKSKLFSYGEYNVNQDKMIKHLHDQVKTVYERCVEEVESSALSMIACIEHKVEEIMQLIEELPPGMFEAIERTRETERRAKMLLEKQLTEKQRQMERQRLAAERAASDIKRMTTRRLVYRSQPPKMKKKDTKRLLVKLTQEQLDAEYYFT